MRESHEKRVGSVELMIRRVKKLSISEEIAKQIMDLIANGDLKPGQRLPSERELCEHFGASRTSLREALRCLSIVGVLNASVRNGTSVALDGEKFLRKIIEWRMITEMHDVENLMLVRIALEGVSAEKTALDGSEEDIDKIRKLLSKMKDSTKDPEQFMILDLEFHIALARASGNALLLDLISLIRGQLAKTLPKVLKLPNAMPLSLKEHTSVFRAIERREANAAHKAMTAHLKAALGRYWNARESGKIERKSQS